MARTEALSCAPVACCITLRRQSPEGKGIELNTRLLSAVLPTHNRPELLERAANSVLSQVGTDVELVIVDDASDDHTHVVAERLAQDPRVKLVHNSESIGPGAARNKGIAVASGDMLGFCDDDDEWLPGAAAVLVGYLEADKELGVVTSWHQVAHDGTGRTADYRGPLKFGVNELLWFNFVALPFGIIRRSSFPDGLVFDASLPPCEDWDMWLRCARVRPIEVVPRVLYSYHQHGGDRVTKVGSGNRGGRQAFLDKHAAAMTEACQAYHRAVIAEQTDGRGAMIKSLLTSGSGSPAAAGYAGSILASGLVASTVGMRRRDPALASRIMYRLLKNGAGESRSETSAP